MEIWPSAHQISAQFPVENKNSLACQVLITKQARRVASWGFSYISVPPFQGERESPSRGLSWG
jgi:hypothetical protein